MDVQTNDAAFSVIGFSSRRRAVQSMGDGQGGWLDAESPTG